MKRTIKLAVVAALALGATSAFATNGDVMIGQGAKSRAMGGVGIAKSFGAESSLANPAMISTVKDSEFTFVITGFAPSVAFKSNAASQSQGAPNPAYADSAANFSVIPELAFASRINDNIVYGVSFSGTAGMGTDYSGVPFGLAGDNGGFQMKTALSLAKLALPIAYTTSGITVAIAPIIQGGSLELSHMRDTSAPGTPPAPTDFKPRNNGASVAFGFGYEIGLSAENNGFTAGMVYKSKIAMKYDNTIGASINDFGGAAMTGVSSGDNLDQPAEIGLGLSYEMGGSTIALDYKNIAWGDAAGYKDFGWENQNVYAVGYEYAGSGWAFRAGYNYGKSPIVEQKSTTNAYGAGVRNFFNLSGFPGIVETHMTIGAGYDISESLSLDTAFVYVPEVTNSFNTGGMTAGFIAGAGGAPTGAEKSSADVTHSQMGLTIAASYKF